MRANQACFDALDLDVHLTRRPNQVDLSIQAKGTIGAYPLRAPDTHHIAGGVIVCPRFGWNSIGSLLSAIGWSAAPELINFPQVPGSAREIPSWVIAGPAVNHLEQLLQYSNPRFRYVEELRSSPRGQINWDDYCSRRITSGNPHLMSCRFPDLAADEKLRSHIRWALERISADLYQFTDRDVFALKLLSRVKALIASIYSVKPLPPSQQELLALQRQMQQSPKIALGFEAIRWMTFEAWAQLSQQGLALRRGIIEGMDRTVRVALLGVPIELKNGIDLSAVTEAWCALRRMD